MSTINSGKFGSVSGTFFGGAINDTSFCFAGASADAYPAKGDPTDLIFGFNAGCIIITNESSNDLSYVFPCLYGILNTGVQVDSGVVKGNSTVVIPFMANKAGIRIRSRASGQSANFIVSAI